MHKDELKVERDGLDVAFDKVERLADYFHLDRMENECSPDRVDATYGRLIRKSSAIILILGRTLRPAVVKEYHIARSANVDVLAYIKKSVTQNPDTARFIKDELHNHVTTRDYYELKDLEEKVEENIHDLLVRPHLEKVAKRGHSEMRKALKGIPERNEVVLRLLANVMFGDDSEVVKKRALRCIVTGLLLKEQRGLDKGQLVQAARSFLPAITKPLEASIGSVIEEMCIDAKLVYVPGASQRLQLSPDRLSRLKTHLDKESGDEKAGLRDFYASVELEQKGVDYAAFCKAVENLILEITRRDAFVLAGLLFKSRAIVDPDTRARLRLLVDQAVAVTKLHGAINWSATMEHLLSSTDPRLQAMLVHRFKGYFILLVLNLDPDCTRFEVTYLQNYKVYLDSYIVLRELAQAGSGADTCHRIVTEGRERGIEMCITKQMLKEVHNSIKVAHDAYIKGGGDVKRIAKVYKQMGFSSDVFDGFLLRKARNKSLRWNTYLSVFWSPTNPRILKDYVEHNLKMKIEEAAPKVTKVWGDRVQTIQSLLLELRRRTPRPETELSDSQIKDQFREIRLRKAEAIQMLAVYRDRAPVKRQQQVWFVTHDEFVYRANAILATKDQFYLEPCYIPPTRWLELTSVFATDPVSESTFREIYQSKEMHEMAGIFDAVVVNQIIEQRIDLQIENAVALRNYFSNLVNQPAVQDAYNRYLRELEKGDEESATKSLQTVVEVLTETLSETKRKLAVVRTKKEKAERTSRYYRAQATKYRKLRTKKGARKARKRKKK